MKTHEMTAEQIADVIKSGNAYIESIAVCGNLVNTGNDPYFIRIEGEEIISYKNNEIDKVTLVSDTPNEQINILAKRVKEAADYLKSESDKIGQFKFFIS